VAAKKAVHTKDAAGRSTTAKKAAKTRAKNVLIDRYHSVVQVKVAVFV